MVNVGLWIRSLAVIHEGSRSQMQRGRACRAACTARALLMCHEMHPSPCPTQSKAAGSDVMLSNQQGQLTSSSTVPGPFSLPEVPLVLHNPCRSVSLVQEGNPEPLLLLLPAAAAPQLLSNSWAHRASCSLRAGELHVGRQNCCSPAPNTAWTAGSRAWGSQKSHRNGTPSIPPKRTVPMVCWEGTRFQEEKHTFLPNRKLSQHPKYISQWPTA